MKITWRGHACFEVETSQGERVIIDPYLANGLTRHSAQRVRADLQLITHAHTDHVGQALDIDAPIVSNFEIATYLQREGGQTTGMNTGGFYQHGHLKVWMAPATHSSGFHTPDGFLGYGGNANGFVLDDGETKFYHAGDTGLFGDMKHVLRDVLKPDVAALPIGDHFTMGPEHAVIAAEWLGVKTAIPMHYNTFEPIEQVPQAFATALEAHGAGGARALVPRVDETLEVKGARIVQPPRPAAS